MILGLKKSWSTSQVTCFWLSSLSDKRAWTIHISNKHFNKHLILKKRSNEGCCFTPIQVYLSFFPLISLCWYHNHFNSSSIHSCIIYGFVQSKRDFVRRNKSCCMYFPSSWAFCFISWLYNVSRSIILNMGPKTYNYEYIS